MMGEVVNVPLLVAREIHLAFMGGLHLAAK